MTEKNTTLASQIFNENTLSLILIVLTAVIAIFPVLFLDKYPFDAHALQDPCAPQSEDSQAETNSATQSDALTVATTYGAYRFINDSAARGDSITWSPLEYGGVPFLALWNTRALSPFTIPFYFYKLDTAFALSAFLKLLIAGWIAFTTARILGLSPALALLLAVTQQTGIHLTLWLDQPISDVFPWFPMLFLCAERIALGQFRYWPTGALSIGLMLLGGAPWSVIASLLFLTIYFTLRIRTQETVGSTRRAIAAAFLAILIGTALAAAQILPAIEWWQNSRPTSEAVAPLPGLTHIAATLIPNWIDASQTGPAPRSLAAINLGVVQIFLTLLWFSLRRFAPLAPRRRIDAVLYSSILLIALAIALGPIVPKFLTIHTVEWLLPCPFALALAGASGADTWLHLRTHDCLNALRRFAKFAVVLFIALIAAAILATVSGVHIATQTILPLITILIIAILAIALITFTGIRPRTRIFGYGMTLLLLLQATLVLRPVAPFTPTKEFPLQSSVFEALEIMQTRVTGTDTLTQWPLAAHAIPQFFGNQPRQPIRHTLFTQALKTDPALHQRTASPTVLLTPDAMTDSFWTLRPSLAPHLVFDNGTVLYECVDCPRTARVIHDARIVTHFDPTQLDSTKPPLIEQDVYFSPPTGKLGRPIIQAPRLNAQATINVQRSDPGVLVTGRAYYPGWTAHIDGLEQEMFPVDGFFLATNIPTSINEVTLTYKSSYLFPGRLITAAAMLTVLIGLLNIIYFRIRNHYHNL